METISSKQMKAKKFHICDYCNLIIELGQLYTNQFNKSSGTAYTWKSHLHCDEIALKLKMYDQVDEGVTGEWFREDITNEFMRIMSENYNEIYESKSYKTPMFSEQLNFVIDHHKKN